MTGYTCSNGINKLRIKAIETEYKNYRFRSRLEARWAVFFDKIGIKWEYEKEGFDLGKSGKYLPDFWFPDFGAWCEVKPQPLECDNSLNKALCLVGGRWESDYVDEPLIELVGLPDYKSYRIFCITPIPICLFADPKLSYNNTMILTRHMVMMPDILNYQYSRDDSLIGYQEWKHPEILKDEDVYVNAVNAAKSARFEYGDVPR